MAIIGNLFQVRDRHFVDRLPVVFDYLIEASTNGSTINKRIFNRPMGAFEKVELTDEIFALEQVFTTKERSLCFFESHKKYVDFQLLLSGTEQMEYIDIHKMSPKTSYDPQKDLITYEDSNESSKIAMKKNDLAIFYPEDVHMGLPMLNGIENVVYKTVIKLPVNRLDH